MCAAKGVCRLFALVCVCVCGVQGCLSKGVSAGVPGLRVSNKGKLARWTSCWRRRLPLTAFHVFVGLRRARRSLEPFEGAASQGSSREAVYFLRVPKFSHKPSMCVIVRAFVLLHVAVRGGGDSHQALHSP